ncbi:MAG: protein GrpE [bacterium]|nr:MAG: protein GrpE [bacterium]
MEKEEVELKVSDKRHWAAEEQDGNEGAPNLERLPTYVDQLKKQIEQGGVKLEEYKSAYKERMAENDQFRERLSKDVEHRVESGLANILRMMIPVLDNLQLATESARNNKDIERLLEGVGMIRSGLLNALYECGMKELECLGAEFDPAVAEAVEVKSVKDKEKDNKVLEIVQTGYHLNDKLLRPAKVRVGKLAEG